MMIFKFCPSQGSRIWRAPTPLKLDRRKSQLSSKLLSRQSSAGFIERYIHLHKIYLKYGKYIEI